MVAAVGVTRVPIPRVPILGHRDDPLPAGSRGQCSGAAWRQAPTEGPCWDLSLSFQARTGGGAGSPGWPWGCGGRSGGVALVVADQELMVAVEVVDQKR